MTYTRPCAGQITARWAEMRPLSVPVEKRDHVHGAIDIGGAGIVPLFAPAACDVYRFVIVRPESGGSWKWQLREGELSRLPWGEYTYDIYGGVTVCDTYDGHVHLFCHSYMRQLQDATRGLLWSYEEQPSDARFPVMLWHTFGWAQRAEAGEVIGAVGNAGYSFGPHLHYEIHRGWVNTPYAERPNPEDHL